MTRALKTETNTKAMAGRIKKAFEASGIYGGRFSVDFEHGQHWVTADNGAQWSVCDASGNVSWVIDGFCFEQVSEGEDNED